MPQGQEPLSFIYSLKHFHSNAFSPPRWNVVAPQRPFARLITVARIFAESPAASVNQWRPPKARRRDRRRRKTKRQGRIGRGRKRWSQLAVKCRSREEWRGEEHVRRRNMEGEKDLDVVEVGEEDGDHGDIHLAEPLDCSGSSRSSSGSNGSITPPTDLKVKQKVCNNFLL